MTYPASDQSLARVLKALGHPARLAIVRALLDREHCCCGDIVRRLPLAQSTVSEHLRVLKEAGLVTGNIDGPRACYALDREAWGAAVAALGLLVCGPSKEQPAAVSPSCDDRQRADPTPSDV